MARAIAKTRKRYTPLDLAYSTSVSGALNQNYDANYQAYDPDRSLVPLEILFTVRATDPKGMIAPGIINSKLTDVRWYLNAISEANNIPDSNTAYVIDRNGNTDGRGKITVKKNTPLEGVVLIFTAKYSDPRDGKVVNVTNTISLGVTVSTDEPLRVKVDYPFGQVVDPTEQRDIIEIDNPLFMGDREYEGSIFWWQKKVGSDYTTIAEGESGITGTFSGKLKIPCPAVGKRMDLRCIADVLPDLTGVNLISKEMISDDWNALQPGIVTTGEDADGKYFAVDQGLLYSHTSGATKKDVFGGRVKYKTNQQYRLSVNWKMQAEQTSHGLYFIFFHTDGTTKSTIIQGTDTIKKISYLTSSPDKTVQSIYVTYGKNEKKTLIYDIQLVEYHGASSITTGGAFKRIPASGVSAGNTWGTFPISKKIADTLVPGTKVTLAIEDVNFVAGSANSLTINLYTGTNSIVGLSLPLSTKRLTITIPEKSDTVSSRLLVCEGVFNNTVGNAVELRGVMLTIGETAYKYSPADGEFLPALADGAPRPENLSDRAIITDHVLSTQYPMCDLEIVSPSLILDETSLFEASVVMHSNRGDIVKPELYWGFPWKDKTGAVFARGSRVFINEEQFDDDVFDYEVEAVEGLDEAKWGAKLNGIDQLMYVIGNFSDNSPTINKRHVIEFILNEDVESDSYLIDYHYIQTAASDNKRRVILRVIDGNKLQALVKNKDESLHLTGSLALQKGKLYRCEIVFDSSGQLSVFRVNGTVYPTTTGSATIESETTRLGLGGYASMNIVHPSPSTILRYEFWSSEAYNYLLYDFQPVNGDRSKMLTNKGAGGTWTLKAVNAPNATTEIDPENGFFVTI